MGRHRILIAAILACAATWPASAAEPEQPGAEVLARHGLTRIDRVWMLDDEVKLRRDLAELPKRRERILTLEHDLDERIDKNRQQWLEAQPAIAALRKSLSRFGTDDPQRAVVQQQLDALLAASAEPGKFGGRGETRKHVLKWIDERNGLATTLVTIRRTIGALGEMYQRLAQTPGVAEAIRSSGDKHRLGPQRSYAGDRDKLGDYERLAFTAWVPIFYQGNQLRLSALIDDQSPVTFTWIESGGSGIVLTRTAAEAAGLNVPASAPREPITRSASERTTARRIEVARLRIGKCVLKNVAVLILPPEAEDWGCQISRDALSGHSVRIEPERLRLSIDAS